MNQMNFHQIKTIDVPEELRAKVLAIPERAEKKTFVPFNRRLRMIAAAASVVLIAVVSVVLFTQTGGKPPVAPQPSPTDDATAPTGAPGSAASTGVSESPADPTVQNGSESVAAADPTQRGRADSPSDSRTNAPRTENSHPAPADHSTSAPVQPTASAQTDPPAATQAPHPQPPTVLPWNPATEAAWEDPWSDPTDVPWSPPTRVSAGIPRAQYPKDGKVYCRIEGPAGEVYGSYGLFADERLMTSLGSGGGNYIYTYQFTKYYSVPFRSQDDVFTCIVYDSAGNVLTANVHWFS